MKKRSMRGLAAALVLTMGTACNSFRGRNRAGGWL